MSILIVYPKEGKGEGETKREREINPSFLDIV